MINVNFDMPMPFSIIAFFALGVERVSSTLRTHRLFILLNSSPFTILCTFPLCYPTILFIHSYYTATATYAQIISKSLLIRRKFQVCPKYPRMAFIGGVCNDLGYISKSFNSGYAFMTYWCWIGRMLLIMSSRLGCYRLQKSQQSWHLDYYSLPWVRY